ncbi:hypothetical protein NSPZN2_80075 [Nitrospira defluvii]|uniref:Uncharacterized protein n=1 Tax=Nitrospira defluvii TaxID=330214 RepID=A0ABM8SCJ0_9BACT|nr:hypothetical protein NSPZN2_80075 [Nitrospira defluvii]
MRFTPTGFSNKWFAPSWVRWSRWARANGLPPICRACWRPAPAPLQAEPPPHMVCIWYGSTIRTRLSPIPRKELSPETDVPTFVIVLPTIPSPPSQGVVDETSEHRHFLYPVGNCVGHPVAELRGGTAEQNEDLQCRCGRQGTERRRQGR